jgi:hypothetical protein
MLCKNMERAQIKEFHFLAPIANVPSILQHGILSHNRAKRLPHTDVAMEEIQEIRAKKKVPGGRALHDYANLFFNGRNKMMAKKRPQHAEICVLRIRPEILDCPDAVIADQNGASKYVLFLPSPAGLKKLDRDEVFVRSWVRPGNPFEQWRLGSKVCAELLVPNRVEPAYVFGAYVVDQGAQSRFEQLNVQISCQINSDIFLR